MPCVKPLSAAVRKSRQFCSSMLQGVPLLMRQSWRLGILVLLSGWALGSDAASYTFGYDDAGRLLLMQGSAGSGTYAYDAAGNLTTVAAPTASSVVFAGFSPAVGPVGTHVTVSGLGFSGTTSSNVVTFNGVQATVVSASTTSLVVTVPAGASSGPITVTVGSSTGSSTNSFSIVTSAPDAKPTLTAVSKIVAAPGDAITLTGTNFLGSGFAAWVRVNGQPATITSISNTQIVFTVPSGLSSASSGRIEIGSQNGTILQSGMLYIAPSGTAPSAIATPGAIVADGTALSTSVPLGQTGLYTFEGQVGQHLGLGISNINAAGSAIAVSVLAPNGSTLINCSSTVTLNATTGGGACELPTLQASGTYTVVVTPSGATTSMTLTLSSDVLGSLSTATAPQNFAASRVGRSARYTFTAQAGDNYSVNWSASTLTSSGSTNYLYVYRPDGTLLTTSSISGTSGLLDLRYLPLNGTYTVLLRPAWNATGSVNLALNVAGQIAIGGTPAGISLPAGQNGYYVFSATAGQHLGLAVGQLSTVPSNAGVTVSLLRPDGKSLMTCQSNATTDGSCNMPSTVMTGLPMSGTYTVVVTPYSGASASLNLALTADVISALTANAAAQTVTLSPMGQNGRYSFNATAGQSATLVWANSSVTGSSSSTSTLSVYGPDGTQLQSGSFGDSNSATGSGALALTNLTVSGLYTVFIDPADTKTGSVDLQLRMDDTQTLAVDGAPLTVTLASGQSGDYAFNGTVGQQLGLGLSAVSLSASGTPTVSLYAPGSTTPISLSCAWDARGSSCNLPTLPSTGSYVLHITPPKATSGTLTLTLSSDYADTLIANDLAKQFSTNRVGRNARYTFNATAGQNVSVSWNGSTFPYSGKLGPSSLYVLNPDGSRLSPIVSVGDANTGPASGTVYLGALQQSGTYTLFFDPVGVSTGALNLQLLADDAQSLAVDGASLPINLNTGQAGDYSFSGTTGQNLGLGITAMSLSANGSPTVALFAPGSTTAITLSCAWDGVSGSCNLPALTSTGTYTLRLTPPGTASGSLTLTLSTDASGTLNVGGAVQKFATTRAGQNARYGFDATAGQNINVLWSGSTLPYGTYCSPASNRLSIRQPDGSELQYAWFGDVDSGNASGSIALTNLQQSGRYTAYVDPACAGVGAVNLQITQTGTTSPVAETVAGALIVNGSAVPVTVSSGQTLNYSFSGTVGQHVGLGITGVNPGAAGGSVNITVLAPDNTTVLTTDCRSYSTSGGSCNLPWSSSSTLSPTLPSTGTYTLRLAPAGSYSVSMNLALYGDALATLSTSSSTATVFDNTTHLGQKARYTFNATAGQNLSLGWSNATYTSYVSLQVYNPDGSRLDSRSIYGNYYSNGKMSWINLPQTGTYTVYVDPGVTPGSVGLQLLADASQALMVGTPLPNQVLATNRSGDYTFSGTVGQQLGLGLSNLQTTPAGGYVKVSVLAPDGMTALATDCSNYYASSGGGSCNLAVSSGLPSTGTYTVHIEPQDNYGASFALGVWNDRALTLQPDTAAVGSGSLNIGQNARYSFGGTAGQNVSLNWSGLSFTASGVLRVYAPDGTELSSQVQVFNSTGATTGFISLMNLAQTGTYQVFVDPQGIAAGSLNMQLQTNATGALAVNNTTALSIALTSGRSGDYTFSGTAGQQLGVGLDTLTTATGSGGVAVTVIAPDGVTTLGTTYTNCSTVNIPGGSCNIKLPRDGTYIVRVTPQGAYGINTNVTLSPDVMQELVVNGAATQFATLRPGQNGRQVFAGVTGGQVILNWSGFTFGAGTNWASGSTTIAVYSPDGTLLTSTTTTSSGASGTLRLPTLPMDGNYTVFIDPVGASTGQVTTQLTGTLPSLDSDHGAGDSDTPLPEWSYGVLGLSLLAAMQRRRRNGTSVSPASPESGA